MRYSLEGSRRISCILKKHEQSTVIHRDTAVGLLENEYIEW